LPDSSPGRRRRRGGMQERRSGCDRGLLNCLHVCPVLRCLSALTDLHHACKNAGIDQVDGFTVLKESTGAIVDRPRKRLAKSLLIILGRVVDEASELVSIHAAKPVISINAMCTRWGCARCGGLLRDGRLTGPLSRRRTASGVLGCGRCIVGSRWCRTLATDFNNHHDDDDQCQTAQSLLRAGIQLGCGVRDAALGTRLRFGADLLTTFSARLKRHPRLPK